MSNQILECALCHMAIQGKEAFELHKKRHNSYAQASPAKPGKAGPYSSKGSGEGLYSEFKHKEVSILLRAEIKVKGKLLEVSQFDLLLSVEGKKVLIPKHAIDLIEASV